MFLIYNCRLLVYIISNNNFIKGSLSLITIKIKFIIILSLINNLYIHLYYIVIKIILYL